MNPARLVVPLAAALAGALLLSGCNQGQQPASNDAVKQGLDQLIQIERENAGSSKEAAGSARSALDEMRKLTARIEALEKTVSNGLSGQKRAAIYLPLEAEAVCDNDALCNNTARAVCNKVNYPNGNPVEIHPGHAPGAEFGRMLRLSDLPGERGSAAL